MQTRVVFLERCRAARIFAVTLGIFFAVQPSLGADFTSKDYRVGYQPIFIEIYDFNRDGKPDLAVVNENTGNGNGTVSILLGNGDGTFQSAKTFDLGSTVPTSIAVADFNGDGKLDLAVAFSSVVGYSCSGASVYTLAGNGDGTFQAATQAVEMPAYTAYVAAGDVTGDGKADLVVQRVQYDDTCNPGGGYSIFAGNGDGTFQPEQQVSSNPLDFNGDGISDMVTVGGGGLDVFLGQGNGQFQPLATGPEANTGFLVLADMNGDHFQDQAFPVEVCNDHPICFTSSTYVAVALNDGHGNFGSSQIVSPGYPAEGGGILWLAGGDFNGDGKPDLAYINPGTPGFRVILGKGDGTFPALVDFNSGSGPTMFVTADLNGDGRTDVVLANIGDGTISVALSTFPTSGADLAVSVGASASQISVTQNLTYSVSLQNQGPEDATSVVVTDTLPAGMTLLSASMTGGTCGQANLVVTCNISKFVSGDAAALTIAVVPTTTGTAKNSVTVTATETDENTANNMASVSVTVFPMFNLTLTFQGSGTGSVVVEGEGTCPTMCQFSLPYGFPVYLQWTAGANSGFGGYSWSCATNSAACGSTMTSDTTVTADFDTLPNFTMGFLLLPLGPVQAGQGASNQVLVFPEGTSFDSSVTLTCTVQGKGTPAPVCTLSPISVIPGSATGSVNLTLTTTGPTKALSSRTFAPLYAVVLPLSGIAIVGFRRRPSKYGRRTIVFVISLTAFLMIQLACGGGNNSGGGGGGGGVGGTPPGNYTIIVTAVSGAIQHSTSAILTVTAN